MEIEITSSTEVDSDNSSLPSPGILSKNITTFTSNCFSTSIVIDSDDDEISERREAAHEIITENAKRKGAHSVSSSDDSDHEVINQVKRRIRIPLAERLGLKSASTSAENFYLDSCTKSNVSGISSVAKTVHSNVALASFGDQNALVVSSDSETECGIFIPPSGKSATDSLSPVRSRKFGSEVENSKDEAKLIRQKEKEEAARVKKQKSEERAAEKQRKVLEKEREKLQKKVENERLKNYKPTECLKNLKVMIDTKLMNHPEGTTLLSLLQSQEIAYTLHSAPVECSLSWTRKTLESLVNSDNKLETSEKEEQEKYVLVFVPSEMCLHLVQNSKRQNLGQNVDGAETLLDYTRRVQNIFHGKQVTFLVKGISEYFRKSKRKQQRQYRNEVLGAEEQAAPKRKKKNQMDDFDVTELDLEESIISVQVNLPCNITLLESTADIAATIIHHSKAIAQAPYKNEKSRNQQFSWMMDNQKAIAVSEMGDGLLDVWKRQIQQFNNASAEVANAITSIYRSPSELLADFNTCSTNQQAYSLLQNLEVRREAGPLSTTRRVGPELARKMYMFFTSDNPDLNLYAK